MISILKFKFFIINIIYKNINIIYAFNVKLLILIFN